MTEQRQQNWIIGVDFDNTIVSYDALMYRLAVDQNWVPKNINKSKKIIRDCIRQLPEGDIKWQKIQAMAYGCQMSSAHLIDGVKSFFKHCHQAGIPTYIISHKTEYANYDPTRTNLREAAIQWMEQNHFFKPEGLGLAPDSVYFASTRPEKVKRVGSLNCTYFIDDLEETFAEPDFPSSVTKLLFDPHNQHHNLDGVKVLSSWQAIYADIFHANR